MLEERFQSACWLPQMYATFDKLSALLSFSLGYSLFGLVFSFLVFSLFCSFPFLDLLCSFLLILIAVLSFCWTLFFWRTDGLGSLGRLALPRCC